MIKPSTLLIPAMLAIALQGCASHSTEIKAAQVSEKGYKGYDCTELRAESTDNFNRTRDLIQTLDQMAERDTQQAVIGAILFWPVLFALEGGDGPEAAEYARLQGELNAIEKQAVRKGCEKTTADIREFRAQQQQARQAAKQAQQASLPTVH